MHQTHKNFTLKDLFLKILSWYLQSAVDLVKIHAVQAYVKFVQEAREAFITWLIVKFMISLAFAGFILAHIGLLVFLPISNTAKGITLFIMSFVYLLIGLTVVGVLTSQRNWMKFSRAAKLVEKVTENK